MDSLRTGSNELVYIQTDQPGETRTDQEGMEFCSATWMPRARSMKKK